MSVKLWYCLLALCVINCSAQVKLDRNFYTAGVVEFHPADKNLPPSVQLANNLRDYVRIISSPEATEADIIVFPEHGLNKATSGVLVPDPSKKIKPCNNSEYDDLLQELSCAIARSQIYVVINVLEKKDPSITIDSKSTNKSTWNANIVFDRDGRIISRYRKFNNYGSLHDSPSVPDMVVFETDFGVNFGLIICFDILFYYPTIELINRGVRDIIMPLSWISELPFLTALQIQNGLAFATDVNLLTADINQPEEGATGSGIFAGVEGLLVSLMSSTTRHTLLIANVTKKGLTKTSSSKQESKGDFDNDIQPVDFHIMRQYDLSDCKSEYLDIKGNGEYKKHLCYGKLCCTFTTRIQILTTSNNSESYSFHFAVQNGARQFEGNGYLRYKFCAIFACLNKSIESCGRVFEANVRVEPHIAFQYIAIEGQFKPSSKFLAIPNNVDRHFKPLNSHEVAFVKDRDHVKYELIKERSDLLTFGILAMDWENSGQLSVPSFYTSFIFALLLSTILWRF